MKICQYNDLSLLFGTGTINLQEYLECLYMSAAISMAGPTKIEVDVCTIMSQGSDVQVQDRGYWR